MKIFRYLLKFGVILAVATCASSFAQTAPSSVKLHFLRTSSFTAAYWPMIVRIDGKKVAELYRGEYVAVDASAGNHTIHIACSSACSMKSLKIKIQAQKNSDKFIVIDPLYKRSDNLITYTSRAYETDQSSFNSLAEKLRPGKAL